MLIHGGYWRARWHADLMNAMAVDMTTRGLATWNLEYRRIGHRGGGWPGTFEDVAAGADALAGVAAGANLDPARVVVIGHSAGGQLGLWLAARSGLAAGQPGAGPHVVPRGVVALAGVCDLAEASRLNLSDGAVVDLLGGPPALVPDRYAAASPVELVPLGIPQVLVHGQDDDAVPLEMSRRHHRAAVAAGDRCDLMVLSGVDHFDVIDPSSAAWAPIMAGVHDLLA
jgi:acetyl esterase/lipase